MKMECPVCGYVLEEDDEYCEECGNFLNKD
ncbi:zinc-ribbon domain-containing protein [Candidatus Woesearchaeota archaeon]|nr:zinc-ribbon domain-containing protein [Candidatus Woesearchaeota archaeon]